MNRQQNATLGRNFIFGIEDGLVSTVGLLSGIATAGVPSKTIILTGLILIVVEALSMATGSYLSEYSAEEYLKKLEFVSRIPIIGGVVMFFAYITAGMIPLLPYMFTIPETAFPISIILTLLTLFGLGLWSAHIIRLNLLRSGLRMLIGGGITVAIGVLIGGLLK